MNLNAITNHLGRNGHRALLVIQKHSPEILTGVGILAGVTSTVLAAKATLNLEPVLDKIQEKRWEIAEEATLTNGKGEPVHSDAHNRKAVVGVYAHASFDIARLYAPAFSVGLLGVGCIVSAQGIMHKRNAGLAAAYVAVEKGFSEYRKRVAEEFGEDKERQIRYDGEVVRKENTKKGEVEQETRVKLDFLEHGSVYAKFFDETNKNWSKDPEYNKMFILTQQQHANQRLHAVGHFFLNEAYDSLGLERTSAGQVVGWVLDNESGDNFVDFGLFKQDSEAVREFINGHERSILLDFNVDGPVMHLIDGPIPFKRGHGHSGK